MCLCMCVLVGTCISKERSLEEQRIFTVVDAKLRAVWFAHYIRVEYPQKGKNTVLAEVAEPRQKEWHFVEWQVSGRHSL